MAAHIRSKPHYQSVDLTEESFENGTDSRGGDDASRDGVRAFTQKKLGKMQLLKSGRVRIVSNEGKLYEVG